MSLFKHRTQPTSVSTPVKQPAKAPEPEQATRYEDLKPVPVPMYKEGLPMMQGKKVLPHVKQPLLFLIRENHEIEVKEGVPSGNLEITRTNNEKGVIILSQDKLLSIPWGDGVNAWIAFETEATPYPQDVVHDSEAISRLITNIIVNYKDYKTNKLGQWGDLLFKILIGAAILAAVGMIFGGDKFWLFVQGKPAVVATTNVTAVPPGVIT